MNRLTKRDDGNAYFPQCFEEPCNGGGCELEMCDFINQVCEKLAEYEDTGLTPEQVSVLQKDYMWNYKTPAGAGANN